MEKLGDVHIESQITDSHHCWCIISKKTFQKHPRWR